MAERIGALSKARERLRNAVDAARGNDEGLRARVAQLEQELATQRRISLEYFEVIERIEAERNRWCELFREQASQHANAQSMMENAIEKLLRRWQTMWNTFDAYRRDKGDSPLGDAPDVANLPLGEAERYKKAMAELEKSMGKQIDGKVERDQIAERDPARNRTKT